MQRIRSLSEPLGSGPGPTLLVLVLLVLTAAGCEDKSRKAARGGGSGGGDSTPARAHSQAAHRDLEAAAEEFMRLPRPAPVRVPFFRYWGTGVADPVEVALQEAEAAFDLGQRHTQEGNWERARAEFDRAVDRLLLTGLPVREDPRLLYGFEHLVDRIHQLEGEAAANGAPEEPADVPAAIEEIAPLTSPPDPRLRTQVQEELKQLVLDLPITINDRVLSVLDFFQTPRGRRIIENGLRRAGRYRELIHRIFEEEGLPRDLIYLAQAESAFQPHARSRMRAVGIWQFVSYRAREYGLEVNWWVDERRDPVKSTRAAARHLRDLYEQFGDWYLALAAYNGGPGTVSRAVERTGYADYWEMVERRVLPRETSNFVAIILAVALVGKHPERYGVVVDPDPPLRFEAVPVTKPIDLRKVAEVIGVDVAELQELNPHLLRNVTPKQKDFELYVPPGTGETLEAELPRLPEAQRVYWQQHRVRRGETLSQIAARYDSSTRAIAEANGSSLRSLIHPGDVLLIPAPGARPRSPASQRPELPRLPGRGAGSHQVRTGETLWGLALRYGVSVKELERANPFLASRDLRAGDLLTIPE